VTVAADPRRPRVELRRRRRADGSRSTTPTVRWTDPDGSRRRRAFDTFEEADLERARLSAALARRGQSMSGSTATARPTMRSSSDCGSRCRSRTPTRLRSRRRGSGG
jgi:hypothetical protein